VTRRTRFCDSDHTPAALRAQRLSPTGRSALDAIRAMPAQTGVTAILDREDRSPWRHRDTENGEANLRNPSNSSVTLCLCGEHALDHLTLFPTSRKWASRLCLGGEEAKKSENRSQLLLCVSVVNKLFLHQLAQPPAKNLGRVSPPLRPVRLWSVGSYAAEEFSRSTGGREWLLPVG
jgi:hypothetical protein